MVGVVITTAASPRVMLPRSASSSSAQMRLLVAAAAVRIALLLWGEWQDAHMVVKYTDIDYVVFTDAARFMSRGASPYDRDTFYVPAEYGGYSKGYIWPAVGQTLAEAEKAAGVTA